MVVKPKHVGAF